MSILMPTDTRGVLGPNAEECKSRSLFMDRFARPGAKDLDRKEWFDKMIAKPAIRIARPAITIKGGRIVYGQLQSRLMVNMAGGVMENAGLCLDRFGLPYIPGSAVKGCARRMAIQKLREVELPQDKIDLLVRVALAFGWGEQDWGLQKEDGRFKSDFAYAVGPEIWPEILTPARQRLPDFDHFAGMVSFLPGTAVEISSSALPLRPPALGTLELDVVTCHHHDYYQDKITKRVATDDENPIPVIFPTVAAGHVLQFIIAPLRGCSDGLLEEASKWLLEGLSTFGLGAKTATGYGWFDTSPAIIETVRRQIEARAEAERKQLEDQAQREQQRLAEEARRKDRTEFDELTSKMSEDEKIVYALKQLSEPQFISKLAGWKQLSQVERAGIYQLLRTDQANLWLDLRRKATDGKQKEKARWGLLVQDLFKIAKDKKEKMPS